MIVSLRVKCVSGVHGSGYDAFMSLSTHHVREPPVSIHHPCLAPTQCPAPHWVQAKPEEAVLSLLVLEWIVHVHPWEGIRKG